MACEEYNSHGWNHVPVAISNSQKPMPCFDCNICLDFASEPIVTLCGHLYCWPCIYKWLHVHGASLAPDDEPPPQCPVCKADISHSTMVPLYGHGQSAQDKEFDTKDMVIPPRPSACGSKVLASIRSIASSAQQQQLPYRNQNYNFDTYDSYEDDSNDWFFDIEHDPINSSCHPLVRMFGQMVFGNAESLYAYPNSYAQSSESGSSSPIQAEKSLNRLWTFLLCCFILCLAIF